MGIWGPFGQEEQKDKGENHKSRDGISVTFRGGESGDGPSVASFSCSSGSTE